MMKQCPQCGQKFGPLDAVCPKCDVVLQTIAPPETVPAGAGVATGARTSLGAAIGIDGAGSDGLTHTTDLSREPTTLVDPLPPPIYPPPGFPPGAGPAAGGVPGAAAEGQTGGRIFQYTARGRDGRTTSGEINAPTEQAAVSQLREQGLWVSSMREKAGASAGGASAPKDNLFQAVYSGASLRSRAFFFRQLSSLVRAGIPVAEALGLLQGQTGNTLLKAIAGEAAAFCAAGGRMSEVFRRHPRVFSSVILEMISAGEEAGRLERFLEQIADYLERDYQVASRIKGAMTYPAFVVLALIFLPAVPVWVMSGPAAYARETFKWLLLILFVIAAVVIPLRLLLTIPSFAVAYDQVKLALPLVGKVVRQFALSKFGRTLALLYGAGVPIARALSIAAASCGNRSLSQRLSQAVPVVQAGGKLSDAIRQTNCFPPTTLHIIATGEQTGNVDMMVTKMAEFAEADANQAVDQTVALLLPASVMLLGVVVLIRLISFYTGYAAQMMSGGG